MGRSSNQKTKLLFLYKIFLEKTDIDHFLTVQEIIDALASYGISAERKSVYLDIEELNDTNILEIECETRGRKSFYHVIGRDFELPELKLLVDIVQSSKFITEKKSEELIGKLEGLTSEFEAKKLQKQVILKSQTKTINESIYYNVDKLHEAIGDNKQVKFKYFQWDIHKNMEFRHNGEFYEVSPWALHWDDENYYLIAFDSEAGIIKHYRVDKMKEISSIDKERDGIDDFKSLDMGNYNKKIFGMYHAKEEHVKIECKNELAGVMIDRFGKEIMMIPTDKEHFAINVDVEASNQFFGWIISLGDGVKIISPTSVVNRLKEQIALAYKRYEI